MTRRQSRRSLGEGRRLRRTMVLVVLGWVATGWLTGGAVSLSNGASGPQYAGRALGDVLRELQATGLNIVFSSELVRPAMKVLAEPKAVQPREILDEILRPHGLQVRSGPGGALLVVRLVEQTPPQLVLRSSVEMVPVYATVTDARGGLVRDLTVNDFQVLDNGKRQTVTVFESAVQSMSICILLDGSPSLYDAARRTQAAITEFSAHLLPGDRACLGTFSHAVSLDPHLTNDRDALLRHLGDDVPFPAGTAVWDAIEAARSALAAEAGRRVVLIITDAQDNCSRADPSRVGSAVEQDGVLLYGVGVRGKEGLGTGELDALARATGGSYVELKPEDDLTAAMARIADELHRQYLLGFTAQVLDNRVHRIEVKLTKQGLTARTRRSYLASPRPEVR